jgi:ubiquinol oxidase
MYTSRTAAVHCGKLTTQRSAANILKTFSGTTSNGITFRPAVLVFQQSQWTPARKFHSTPRTQIKEFFPEPDTPHIKKTEAAWPHPMYVEIPQIDRP